MSKDKDKIIYIAGPITGVEDYRIKFNKAALELERKGYTVINPAALPEGLKDYMPICYAMIDQAEIIYFLDGWENSQGACLERAYGIKCNKIIINAEKIGIKDPCLNCDCYDADVGCTMSSVDKSYACSMNESNDER